MSRTIVRSLMALSTAFALILALCSGCNSFDPSKWDQEQISKEIKEKHNLTELTLTPSEGGGGYTGTGKEASGESFKITVTQNAAEKSVSYKLDGDRGSIFENKVSAAPR